MIAPPPAAVAAPAAEEGQLLVAWTSTAAREQGVNELRSVFGVEPAAAADFAQLNLYVALLQLPTMGAALQLQARLQAERPTWIVDLNSIYSGSGEARQFALAQIKLPTRAAVTSQRIGVLDGKVARVGGLGPPAVQAHSFVAANDDDAAGRHGTAVALLLAGRDPSNQFQALAYGSKLTVAEVMFDRNGRAETNTGLVLSGLDWLLSERVNLVNASLGGPPNRLLEIAVKVMAARKVPIVAAAGNSGANGRPVYPAAYGDVIAVTAVDVESRVYTSASGGEHVLVAAPGVDVWIPTGEYLSGTSFAAPFVTGAVAMLLQKQPGLPVSEIQRRLCESAKDLGPSGRDKVFGCGLLQVEPLLQ